MWLGFSISSRASVGIWYMDIHSPVGDILFNWGDDNDQLNDPSTQFLNPAWDGKRGSFVW